MDRKADKKRIELLRLSLRNYEDIIIDFEEIDRQRRLKEESYISIISNKDSIISGSDVLLELESKKKVRRGFIWGGGGIVLGIIIKTFF